MQGAKHIGKIVVSQLEERVDSAKHPPIAFREESTYLITGGLGGLGLLVAQWMVEQGARHLVLVGRRGPNDAVRSQLKELEQAGAFVVVAQADVSEAEQVARVLFEIEQSLPPLRGIIHAAGVLDDGILQKLDWEHFAKVLAPKVKGAWNLHTLTQKVPLDDFVLFSSAASLLGSPGQANHVAANAFLDALAYYRRSQGLAGLSINWGAWSDVGAAARRLGGEQMRIKGMGTIAPGQGLQVLSSLLGQGATQVGVLPVKWSTFLGQFLPGSEPPMLSELARQVRQQVKGEQPPVKPLELLRQLKEASSGARQNLLMTSIQGTVAKVLGLSPSQLDVQQPLNTMGLDSLMAVELRNWVKTNLGVDMPMVKFMDGLSVAGLATLASEHLTAVHSTSSVTLPSQGEQKTARMDPSKGVHAESAKQMLAKLDELTDEEVDALLNTMLSEEEGKS
jgi:NADP-dependent 3-hydroxy acid dehydrogenase YdfG/acyl carrier protein